MSASFSPSQGAALPIGIIVVQYGHPDETRRALAAFAAGTPRPARIVVVDNASPDNAADAIAPDCARLGVELVRHTVNGGYAAGINVGLAHLRRDPALEAFAFCNNDVEVAPDYVARCWGQLQSAGPGIASGILHDRDSGAVHFAGGGFVPSRALVVERLDDPGPSAAPYRTDFITACAMLVHRAVVDRLGGLPEVYVPGYLEDAEYAWRARAAGIAQWIVPAARGRHAVSASFGRYGVSPRTTELVVRHRLWWARRNLPLGTRLVALGYQVATKPARGLVELVRGRPAMAAAFARGFWRGLFDAAGRAP